MEEVKVCTIADYGVIGNCRTAALISKAGSVDWCCFPKFDSPSQFARLLDPAGGHFSLTPTTSFQSRQAYREGTNVLTTRFVTERGTSILSDLMSVKNPETHRNELWPDEEILRVLEGEEGETEFQLELLLRGDYGRRGVSFRKIGNWGVLGSDGRKHFVLQASRPQVKLEIEESLLGAGIRSHFRLRSKDRVIVSLSYFDEAPGVIPPLGMALERLEQTLRYWKSWAEKCSYRGASRKLIQRSALTLKLLNYSPSGAFVAAPVTSLPEWIHGTRNWDYRFCWLRDASFTMRALVRLGYLEEAKSFLNWLLHSTRLTWPRLQVVYTVYGESQIKESIADELSGFNNSKPVRLGNHASTQIQLDVYGEVIDSFYSLAEFLEPIDRETRKMVIGFGKAVAELWNQPDQGIWEFRSKPKHYTHSKVMCWVAMDRISKLAKWFGWDLPYDAEKIAFEIRDEIEIRGYDFGLKSYTKAFGESELDASLLVMPLVGYCDANAQRFCSTRDAIIRHLGQNDLIYRYVPESDGFAEPEGAFTICNFWLAEAFARAGDLDEAQRWFNAVVKSLAPLGLISEEIDPRSREYLGNYPQAFSHIGLINAALAIDERVSA